MSNPTHKTYVIRRANDLLSIPDDRLPVFLMELCAGISTMKAAEQKLRVAIADPKTGWLKRFILKRALARGLLRQFIWMDDGKFTASFKFTCGKTMILSEDWTKE